MHTHKQKSVSILQLLFIFSNIVLKHLKHALAARLGITLKRLRSFVTPVDVYSFVKNNLRTYTFLEFLQFRESLNLIGQDKVWHVLPEPTRMTKPIV